MRDDAFQERHTVSNVISRAVGSQEKSVYVGVRRVVPGRSPVFEEVKEGERCKEEGGSPQRGGVKGEVGC